MILIPQSLHLRIVTRSEIYITTGKNLDLNRTCIMIAPSWNKKYGLALHHPLPCDRYINIFTSLWIQYSSLSYVKFKDFRRSKTSSHKFTSISTLQAINNYLPNRNIRTFQLNKNTPEQPLNWLPDWLYQGVHYSTILNYSVKEGVPLTFVGFEKPTFFKIINSGIQQCILLALWRLIIVVEENNNPETH